MSISLRRCLAILAIAALVLPVSGTLLTGQTSKSKSKSKKGDVKALDARVEKLESSMFREIVEISKQYEDAGQPERAKSLLEVLMKLNPQLPGLKERLDELESKAFDAQEIEFVLDTGRTWSAVGAAAAKGKPVRVEILGDYKFQYTNNLTADGITSAEAGQDYFDHIPCGGLMAVVVNSSGKPGKPVHLKSKMQWTPSEDGIVMLKINAPTGHKSTGKLSVKLSGLTRAE